MRPLPVLILVIIAIAVTLSVFFFRGPNKSDSGAAAPAAVSPVVQPTSEAPVIREPVQQPDQPLDTAVSEEDGTEEPAINNRLIGVVLTDKEQPIAGATVKLSQEAMMGESLAMDWFGGKEVTGKYLETQTDEKGTYVFRVVEPGRAYYVMATHPEYAAVQEEGIRVKRVGETRAPELVMRQGSRIFGNVTASDGSPLANAVLHLDSAYMMGMEMKSPDRLTATTDDQGHYEFRNVSAGARNLTCSADGWETQIKADQIEPTGLTDYQLERSFSLSPGHLISGRVFGPLNVGIKGATVTAMNFGATSSSRGTAITDDDGAFIVNGLSQGHYIVMVSAPGFRPMQQTRVQADDVNVQIEMLQQNTLFGHVFEQGANKPVESFTVQVLRTNMAIPQQGSQMMNYEQTNVKLKVDRSADGSFTLPGVDPGVFALKVTAAGFASRITDNFTVVDGQTHAPIDVYLSKGGSIKGRLIDPVSGKPVAGASVSSKDGDTPGGLNDPFFDQMVATRATERKVRSNAEGFFELKMLNAGRYRVQIEHANFTTELVDDIVVAEGKASDLGSIALHPGGSVTGKVVDSAGKPCTRATVRLYNEQTTEAVEGRTDKDGRFSIEHVKPGTYRMSAMRSSGAGANAFDEIAMQANTEVQLQVLEGQTTSRDLTLGN